MRARSGWTLPAVLLSGFALVLPATAALGTPATPPAGPGSAAPASAPAARLSTARPSSVTLPTGQHVRLEGSAGHEQVLVTHTGPAGPGKALVTRRLRSHVYTMPVVAEPYLGRFLDPALFDVTRLSAAVTRSGRIPVRIAYRGSAPAVPGVRVTSAASGVARGYLTPSSAGTFGRALTAQWRADSRAGWPHRSTLFPGVTKVSADVPAVRVVKPAYPMYTLVIKAVGRDGKPQAEGSLLLFNVDDASRYFGFVSVEDGEARVSVPNGHYTALGEDFTYDEATDTESLRLATVNEFRVTGSGQTLTVDYRRATARPTVTLPKPTDTLAYSFEWDRVDATRQGALASRYDLESAADLRLAPAPRPKVGTVDVTHTWWAVTRAAGTNPDTYTAAARQHQIPANPHFAFRAASFGVVHATYFGDGSTKHAASVRFPLFSAAQFGGGVLTPVTRGARRNEYVAANAPATWGEAAVVNDDSFDDPGFLFGPNRRIAAGHSIGVNWFRGPLAAAIPVQQSPGVCYGCRWGNRIGIFLAPFTDSNPAHVGNIFGSEDGLPVARFRFYRNAKLVSDRDDYLGGLFAVSRHKATYKAVLDVDRRLMEPAQSTRSRTELTFSSAKNKGKNLPKSWYCDGSHCRVLPVVQARVALPTDLQGRLPARRSTVTVVVAAAQGSAKSPVTRAGLEIRPAGWFWSPVRLTSIGGGRYQGVVDNRELEGSAVDVRLSAADKAGSTFSQTTLRAYSVSPS